MQHLLSPVLRHCLLIQPCKLHPNLFFMGWNQEVKAIHSQPIQISRVILHSRIRDTHERLRKNPLQVGFNQLQVIKNRTTRVVQWGYEDWQHKRYLLKLYRKL